MKTEISRFLFFRRLFQNACYTKNDGRDKKSLPLPTDLILLRLAHLDISTAKMSTEMTFWHLWVPNKSKHDVRISQACVSFCLAVACDLLCNYCGCHSEYFWLVSGNSVLHLLYFEYIKTSPYPLVELTGAASIIPSSALELISYWLMHSHLSSYLDTVESRTWIKHVS